MFFVYQAKRYNLNLMLYKKNVKMLSGVALF